MPYSSLDVAGAAARAARRAQADARRAAIAAGLEPDLEIAVAPWQPPPVEPAPCDDGCRFRERCSAGRLACQAFAMFVAGESAPRWSAASRAPTGDEFAAIFGPRRRKPRRPTGQRSNQELMQQFLLED